MTCLQLNHVQTDLKVAPTRAYLEIARVVQGNLVQLAAQAATSHELQDAPTFQTLIEYAVAGGLSATEIATLVGVSKSTVLRWASGASTPHYGPAREIFARKILERLKEHWEKALYDDGCGDLSISVAADSALTVTLKQEPQLVPAR
jgi:DNA-binding transcriptional regulator YiaG